MDDQDKPDLSLGDQIRRLKDSGRDYAQAEWHRQKLRAGIVATGARSIAIYVVLALIIVFAAIVALLVGLVIALSPLITPIGAAMAVPFGALVIAFLFLLGAKAAARRMKEDISS